MTARGAVTAGGSSATAVPPWTLALGAMLSVQLGSALSVPLIEQVGAAGTAWLRLTFGALVFLALARPGLRSLRRADVLPVLGLASPAAPWRSASWARSGASRSARRWRSRSSARSPSRRTPEPALAPLTTTEPT